jgi:putative ABC transport system ATP-binding protein
MITFRHVEKFFGSGPARVAALRGIDLEIPEAEMCAVMGPSGAGKSTLLHLAGGLTTPDVGEVIVAGKDLSRLSQDELALMRRREIGIVFQFFNLLPYLSAYDNVALSLQLDALGRTDIEKRVSCALELVGLASARAQHRPSELSGGEMQRVAIARALVISPTVLLADEPTGNLDSVSGRQIMDILRDINDETRVTTLIVTHDPVWASACDRIVRVVDGRISEDLALPGDNRSVRGDTIH